MKLKTLNPWFFIIMLFGIKAFAQKEIKVHPYTIETTYQKLKKDYPFIISISEIESPEIIKNENVTYRVIDNIELKADIYTPNTSLSNYPAILLIHGGGWISGSKENERVMAQHLAKNGFVAMTAAYTLSTEAIYPASVLDLKSAIKWMRKNAKELKINPDKIAVLGASAGAQLATLIGVTPNHLNFNDATSNFSEEVHAIINIDGIVSFIHPDAEESEIAGKWLGGLQHENPKNWKEASPLECVGKNTPPILFINSTQPRFHAGRDDMIKILNKNNIYSEVHTVPNSPHSFWLMQPWFDDTLKYTIDFLNKIFDKD